MILPCAAGEHFTSSTAAIWDGLAPLPAGPPSLNLPAKAAEAAPSADASVWADSPFGKQREETIMLDSLGDLTLTMRCSACMKIHKWQRKDAWVDKSGGNPQDQGP